MFVDLLCIQLAINDHFDTISVYIEPSIRKRENERDMLGDRRDMLGDRRPKQGPRAPAASKVEPCLAIIQISRTPKH